MIDARRKRWLTIGALALGAPIASFTGHAAPASVLESIVIVTRHGVRSPTWTQERLHEYSAEPWPEWTVPPGDLTPRGRQLMTFMGGYYRELLTKDGLMGSPGCGDAAHTYIWADTDQRTMESARALSETMLPGCASAVHSLPAESKDPLFDPIDAGAAAPNGPLALAAVGGRIGPTPDALLDAHRDAFHTLDRVLAGAGTPHVALLAQPMSLSASRTGVTMTGPLAVASSLTEALFLEYADGMSGRQFAWGRLDAAGLEQIMALHTAFAELTRRTPYLATVRGSNLLSHIVRTLEQVATGKATTGALAPANATVVVVSGHDTNLSSLSGLLRLSWVLPGYQPDDAPPGGALAFSLWRDPQSGAHSVRLQFIAQTPAQMHLGTPLSLATPPVTADVFVPGCGTASDGFACDWATFRKVAGAAIDPAFVY